MADLSRTPIKGISAFTKLFPARKTQKIISNLLISKMLAMIILLVLVSCAGYRGGGKPVSGVYHRVKKGDTLQRIAQAYKVNVTVLAEANYLNQGAAIEAGQVLFIPDARQVAADVSSDRSLAGDRTYGKEPAEQRRTESIKKDKSDQPRTREANSAERTTKELPPGGREISRVPDQDLLTPSAPERKKLPPRATPPSGVNEKKEDRSSAKIFIWPVAGKVVSRFGVQANGMYFNGIKIAAPEGTPVVAAAAGTVIFSASLKDYGETVIIKHEGDYATVYSYLGQRLVKQADRLQRGDPLAVVSKPESRGNALLYFEVRHKNQARNPLLFLP